MNMGVLALVVGLVMICVMIPIGLYSTALIHDVMSGLDMGTSGNATRSTLFGNIFSAYNLSVIVPIVAAAGVIISIVGAYFTMRKV